MSFAWPWIFLLLPLQTTPRSLAGPDLLLAFAVAWCLRRPEFVPPLALALAFLLADLLLQRPPGLWALLALFTVGSAPVPPLLLNTICFASSASLSIVP